MQCQKILGTENKQNKLVKKKFCVVSEILLQELQPGNSLMLAFSATSRDK